MPNCYDRSRETQEFENCQSRVIVFTCSEGNGMTTFLLNKLQNSQYIFIRENAKGNILFDLGDSESSKNKDTYNDFLDYNIEALENLKWACNLLYFHKIGTFLRNMTTDSINIKLKKLNNAQQSFDDFLDYYINTISKEPINLIIDKADNVTTVFLSKVKKFLHYDNVRLIFCYASPLIKAEFKEIFDNYFEIIFCKPTFENARIIFDNLQYNCKYYTQEMYESAKSFKEFRRIYLQKSIIDNESVDYRQRLICDFLSYFECPINNFLMNQVKRYFINNAKINNDSDFEDLLTAMVSSGVISKDNNLYFPNFIKKDLDDTFKAFIKFSLNEYQKINIDALYYMYTVYSDAFTSDQLKYLLFNTTSKTELEAILKHIQLTTEKDYLSVYNYIYNLKIYSILPEYPEMKNRYFNILKILKSEKMHLKTSPNIYIRNIKQFNTTNINFACLNVILYFDYCINHCRNKISQFVNKKTIFNFENYFRSDFYYILESIVAFYIDDFTTAKAMYKHAISNAQDGEKIYLRSNLFAFLLKNYINKTNSVTKGELDNLYNEMLCTGKSEILSNNFLNANLQLYKSIINNKSEFVVNHIDYNDTWNLFKLINSEIIQFAYSPNYDISNYLKLESHVLLCNRIPTKNLFYYNLYIMGLVTDNRIYQQKALQYMNSKEFKHSKIYEFYQTVKTDILIRKKCDVVKYGYIFSRVFDLNYLLNEIALLTN